MVLRDDHRVAHVVIAELFVKHMGLASDQTFMPCQCRRLVDIMGVAKISSELFHTFADAVGPCDFRASRQVFVPSRPRATTKLRSCTLSCPMVMVHVF